MVDLRSGTESRVTDGSGHNFYPTFLPDGRIAWSGAQDVGDRLLLVVGYRNGKRLCAALDVFYAHTLWGRYWGTHEYVPGLHFEACYYQAIEFCIERGIACFEGGAQGIHKLARGLLPVATHSAHAIADQAFASAIGDYCARERVDVAHSIDELEAGTPFRSDALE